MALDYHHNVAADEVAFRASGGGIHGTLFAPRERRVGGGVLVIGGSGGSEPSYVAGAFAGEGVTALSVAYFARPGLPQTLRDVPLEYFRDALDVLGDHLALAGEQVVLIGMSRGSEAALLTAIHFDAPVAGVIVTVPGSIVAGGLVPGSAAWLLDGRPLPYSDDQDPGTDPAVVIAAERVSAAIMMISAGRDEIWPSADMARAIQARREARAHPYRDELAEYPDAGHSLGYLVPDLPAGLLPADVAERPADREARADAWPKALRFALRCLS